MFSSDYLLFFRLTNERLSYEKYMIRTSVIRSQAHYNKSEKHLFWPLLVYITLNTQKHGVFLNLSFSESQSAFLKHSDNVDC